MFQVSQKKPKAKTGQRKKCVKKCARAGEEFFFITRSPVKRKLERERQRREREIAREGKTEGQKRQLAKQAVESLKKLKVSSRQLQIKRSQQMSDKDEEEGERKLGVQRNLIK